MEKHIEEAKQIIADNIYMTIATATIDGVPWISPVFFAYDDQYNLFWVSDKNSHHSQLIRANNQVAIVIFDSSAPEGEGDGVYFEATVSELKEKKEVEHAARFLGARVSKEEFRIKKIEEVTGEGIWRIYKAIPQKISKLTEGEYINGQYVDKRIDLKLT